MRANSILLGLLAAGPLALTSVAVAQAGGPQNPPPAQASQEQKKQDPPKEEPKKEEPKRDPKALDYEKAVKDLTKVEGPFTLYQRKKDLLLELPESKLGEVFCLQASLNTGVTPFMLQAGFPVGDFVVEAYRFEKHDENVWLIRPHLSHRWEKDDPLAVASERSFPEAILASYRIEQSHPEKKLLLVNLTSLFHGDVLRLSEAVQMTLGGPYMLDRERTSPESVKGYPQNTVVRMNLHYLSQGRRMQGESLAQILGLIDKNQLEDDRSAPLKVTYNLWFREDSGYAPRLADPRVGYFTNDFYSLGRFGQDDRQERYIWRVHLRKKDPSAKLSEPVKPIVWHIDTSVPKAYRQACADGILLWNRAFEALGYRDAIRVQFVDDGDKDWDHADGRHNVLRWAMSEDATYAISMARTDPFTGEILNASVNVDANVLFAAFTEYERFSNPAAAQIERAIAVLTRNDARDAAVTPEEYLLHGESAVRAKGARKSLAKLGWARHECSAASGKAEHAAFAWTALAAANVRGMSKEEYAKEFLRDIVSHEIGHTLGLRHNFIGSTLLTTEELGDDRAIERQGISASVMDYTPVNVMAVLRGGKRLYTSRIGPYDVWAIKYGYMDVPGAKTPIGERHALSKVAALSGQPEFRFMTDEEVDGFDPFVARFDNARDPLRYSANVMEAARRIREYVIAKLPRPGEGYAKRTAMILGSMTRTMREGISAARFVGGLAGNRNFRGDVGQSPTLAPVNPNLQREAVRLVARNCLAATSARLPDDVLVNLSRDPSDATLNWTAPIRQIVGQQQNMLYAMLMSASTTSRIAENQLKWGSRPGAYGLDEHFATVLGVVFSEVGANKPIPALRRDLQRFSLNALMTQAGAAPGGVNEDVRMLASDSLRRLSARFGAQLKASKGLDSLTVVHLRDAKDTMDRFLTRIQVTGR